MKKATTTGVILRDAIVAGRSLPQPLFTTSFDCWNIDAAEGVAPDWDDSIAIATVAMLLDDLANKLRFDALSAASLGTFFRGGFNAWYLDQGRAANHPYGNAWRDVARILIANDFSIRLEDDGIDIYRTSEISPEIVEDSRKITFKGYLLDLDGEVDPISLTHYDCWHDEESDHVDKEDVDILYDILTIWSQHLRIPAIDPGMLAGAQAGDAQAFRRYYRDNGQDAVMAAVCDIIVAAGYSVYNGDEYVHIYETDDLVGSDALNEALESSTIPSP